MPEAEGILTHTRAERQKLSFRWLPSAIFSRQVLQRSLTFCNLTVPSPALRLFLSLSHTHSRSLALRYTDGSAIR